MSLFYFLSAEYHFTPFAEVDVFDQFIDKAKDGFHNKNYPYLVVFLVALGCLGSR